MALRFLNSGYFAGKVGIGTDSPDAKLDVRSASRTAPVVLKLGNGIISGDNGVIVSQIRSYINNSNTAADELARIQVENGSGSHDDGNLSFWTRDGLNNVDAAKQLQINGRGVVDIKNDGTALLPVLIFGADVDTGFFRPSSNNIALSTTGVERVRVTSGGNVGIGVTSSINGTLTLPNSGIISFHDANGDARNSLQFVSGELKHGAAGAGLTTQTFFTNSSERMRIASNGNVGIGTIDPIGKLEVRSSVVRTSVNGGADELVLQNAGYSGMTILASNTTAAQIHFGDDAMSNTGMIQYWNNTNSMTFSTNGGSEKMRINSAGNVGINTTSPDFKLDVDGTFGVSDLPFNTDSVSVLVADEILGNELITNGDFSASTGWGVGSGWAIANGKASVNTSSTVGLTQSISVTSGNVYKVSVEVSNYTSGSLQPQFGGGQVIASISANGKYVYTVTSTITNPVFYLYAVNVADFSVDNVSVKQVTSASNQIQKRELSTGAFANIGDYLPLAGGTMTGNTDHNDNVYSRYGTADQLRIWNNGLNSYIFNYSSGNINIGNDAVDKDVIFYADRGDGLEDVFFRLDGSETNGTTVLGVTLFPDKSQVRFGNSGDLRIYHDGSNSYISDGGTGDLYIQGSDDIYITAANGEKFITCNTNDSVEIRYDNVKKFETTSSGVTVTGDVVIDSALLSNQENTDVDTGTETVANVAIATYTAAFFDFVIKKTTNVRSGTVYACHDGTSVVFTETSTNDLGDTSDVTLSVDISGGNMRLLATVTSDDWSVKSLIRAI